MEREKITHIIINRISTKIGGPSSVIKNNKVNKPLLFPPLSLLRKKKSLAFSNSRNNLLYCSIDNSSEIILDL